MHKRHASLWALLAVVAVPAIAGCSRSFWDRSPPSQGRVQGIYVPGPLADVGGASDPVWKNPVLTGDPDGVRTAGGRDAVLTGDPDGQPSARANIPMPSEHDLSCLAEVNRVRAQHGVPAVRFESKLFAAAYLHSQEQMRDGFLGHDSRNPEHATLGQRMQHQGYVGRTYAEVVAKDFPDSRSVVAAWMDSPRHREVLLDPDLLEAAFARVDGPANRTNRWTGDFADPGRSYTPLPTPPAGAPVAAAPVPQVPNPATRASVPATPSPRSGVMPSARPAIPMASAPAPSATFPAPAPVQQPRVVAPPQPIAAAPRAPATNGNATNGNAMNGNAMNGNATNGNYVPPAAGSRAAAPAAPFVVQPRVVSQAPSQPRVVNQQPRTTQPQPSAPYVATAPRSTYVPPPPVQPYRPSAPRPRTRAKCGPGG